MAKRSETERRKADLEKHLRELSQSDLAKRGFRMPAHRELAAQFELSTHTVFRIIRSLQDEGVLVAAAGVGVFARRPPEQDKVFCFLDWEANNNRFRQLYSGFAQEIANSGCLSALVQGPEGQAWIQQKGLGIVAGVFATYKPAGSSGLFAPVPHVGFYEHGTPEWDAVSFDDEEGGWLAASHLIECGHRSIAFVGCHRPGEAGPNGWSQARATGFARAAQEAGPSYRWFEAPCLQPRGADHRLVGRDAAAAVLAKGHCTGVVAANSLIAEGLFAQLRDMSAPRSLWPSVAAFQDSDADVLPNVAQVVLDYNALGRLGARLLLDRHSGAVESGSVRRMAPARLVPSLTSHPGWALRVEAELLDLPRG